MYRSTGPNRRWHTVEVLIGWLVFCMLRVRSVTLSAATNLRVVELQGTRDDEQHSVVDTSANLLRIPGARADAAVWCDPAGNVWLFGGEGYDDDVYMAEPRLLHDLWMLNSSRLEWSMIHSGSLPPTFSGKNQTYKLPYDGSRFGLAPSPRKNAASCGVPGIIFVIFGGFTSDKFLSETWIFRIPKARWLPLFLQGTNWTRPPLEWVTRNSWCYHDALFVLGGVNDNIMELWKFSLVSLEWTNETRYPANNLQNFTEQSDTNVVPGVWNGTFYLYHWQMNQNIGSGQHGTLSIDVVALMHMPSANFTNWRTIPLLWHNLNSEISASMCRLSPLQTYNSYLHCSWQKSYNFSSDVQLEPRSGTSSWFYKGSMFVFGGRSVNDKAEQDYHNNLWMVQQPALFAMEAFSEKTKIILGVVGALVILLVIVVSVFFFWRFYDYRHGRSKSKELRVRYTLLENMEYL